MLKFHAGVATLGHFNPHGSGSTFSDFQKLNIDNTKAKAAKVGLDL
jgi:hypothetical protein